MRESIEELKVAKDKFIAGIKKAIISALVRGAMNGLVNLMDKMIDGDVPSGAKVSPHCNHFPIVFLGCYHTLSTLWFVFFINLLFFSLLISLLQFLYLI